MSLFKNRKRDRLGNSRVRKLRARRRLLSIEGLESRRLLTANPPLVVTVGDGTGAGTLYEMIQLANSQPGADKIVFASGVTTVRPSASLPWITDALSIDGENRVTLDGSGSPGDGLMISGSNVGVFHLTVGNYANGNGITFLGASDGRVQGSRIGTDQAGLVAMPNRMGLFVHNSTSIVIGTDGDGVDDATEGNLISGNTEHGLQISGDQSRDNVVAGNLVGFKTGGTELLSNGSWAAVVIRDGARFNRIGTNGDGISDVLERNVSTGSNTSSFYIHNASDNVISGNYGGLDITGSYKVGSVINGVGIGGGSQRNLVGVNDDQSSGEASEGNVLSGVMFGVAIVDATSTGNRVSGNLIGTDKTGGKSIAINIGVVLAAPSNVVGTDGDGRSDALERNVISSATEWGIRVNNNDAHDNRIAGNYIGTDITGTIAFGNQYAGIGFMLGAQGNLVGTNADGVSDDLERNIISGGNQQGIWIFHAGTSGNRISGNYIGTNASGTAALANQGQGVRIDQGASLNIVGTNGDGIGDSVEGNLISGNGDWGIFLDGQDVKFNRIAGNRIGTDANGNAAIPNAHGIAVYNRASSNIIGTNGDGSGDALEGNLISGNTGHAIFIVTAGTNDNIIAGNRIGVDATGNSKLSNNGWTSVYIDRDVVGTRIGTNGDGVSDLLERNVISGSAGHGLSVGGANTTIAGNYIGTNTSGTVAIPNNYIGLYMFGTSSNSIIGTNGDGSPGDAIEGNLISGNGDWGIFLDGQDVKFNRIAGNQIGTDASGTSAIPNMHGIGVFNGASSNIIGTNGDGSGDVIEGNLISGNTGHAIYMVSAGTNNNVIAGNRIGVDATGNSKLSNNGWTSVYIDRDVVGTRIGTNGDGVSDSLERNVISGSALHGLVVGGANTTIAGNYIGTNASGTAAIKNNNVGLYINGTSSNSVIGTNGDGSPGDAIEGNLISGNGDWGVVLDGADVKSNRVAGNRIGTDASGTFAIPNTHGIGIWGQASGNIIGTNGDGSGDALEGNLISGNTGHAIYMVSAGTNNNVIAGNWIGVDATGNTKLSNNGWTSIFLNLGVTGNRIGTNGDGLSDALERNIISGSAGRAIAIRASNNTISGNYIGTSPTGDASIPNKDFAIVVAEGGKNNIIGVDGNGSPGEANEGNLISGNSDWAILLADTGTSYNRISGNKIGTTANGLTPLPNLKGIAMWAGASENIIGTDGNGISDTLEGNLISGNSDLAIYLASPETSNNAIAGNWIGVDAMGNSPLKNGSFTNIFIQDATGTRIGTNGDGISDIAERNVISANTYHGISIQADNTKIAGNYIGTNASGTASIPNGSVGINIEQVGKYNIIGVDGDGSPGEANEGNLISASAYAGIRIAGVQTSFNRISGNKIGTNADGTASIPNDWGIVLAEGTSNNLVGVNNSTSEGNLISGNKSSGIVIQHAGTSNNRISGNRIGTKANGFEALPNQTGITIWAGASNNILGSNGDGSNDAIEGNFVSGNSGNGIYFRDANTSGNSVLGNYIGVDAASSPNGAVSWYRGEGNARDFYERNNAVFFDGSYVPGKVGQAFHFNGSQYLDIPYSEQLVPGYGSFSAELWLRTSSTKYSPIIEEYECGGVCNSGSGATWRLLIQDGKFRVHIRDSDRVEQYIDGNVVVNDGRYHHLAFVRDVVNQQLILYVDGQVDVSVPLTVFGYIGSGDGEVDPITIGYHRPPFAAPGDIFFLEGDVDEPTIYSRALLPTEVSRIYQADSAGKVGFNKLANGFNGILVENAPNQIIGGQTASSRNVIVSGSVDGTAGVFITGNDATGNKVQGNYIGTDVNGTFGLGGGVGVYINNASLNVIGGEASAGNMISGHTNAGVNIVGSQSQSNWVAGNKVGTDFTGFKAIPNNRGITLGEGAKNNIIGTNSDGVSDALESNLISGNNDSGVYFYSGSTQNIVAGNLIGTDVTGTNALGNAKGIYIANADHNVIGSNGDGNRDTIERNIISGNKGEAVEVAGSYSIANRISGNYIGTDTTGLSAVANRGNWSIVLRDQSKSTLIGTNGDGVADDAEGNVISGNLGHSILVTDSGTNGTVIAGNIVGLNANGDGALGNQGSWISVAFLNGAGPVRLGTDGNGVSDDQERNVISSNAGFGVGMNTSGNTVAGNYIGTDKYGTQAFGNGILGVVVFDGGSNNIIGTNGDGQGDAVEGNVISANTGGGIGLRVAGSTNNRVSGNFIGTDKSGVFNLGNGDYGIAISHNTSGNLIGTDGNGVSDDLEGNVISGNRNSAVLILNSNNNQLSGNKIGTDGSGVLPLGNGGAGISISDSQGNIIGIKSDKSAGDLMEGNVISSNGGPGIEVVGAATQNTTIAGNIIGSALGIDLDLGNGAAGISVYGNATGTSIGGPNAEFGNLIAYNAVGLRIDVPAANITSMRHNRFIANDSIAIDIGPAGSTPNDSGDTDGFRNAPVITSVRKTDDSLIIEGFSRPGAEFDLYQTRYYASGLGQGETFLARVFEGGLQDQDSSTGTYDSGSVGGVPVGTDTTNRFRFVLPLSALQNPIESGDLITAVAAEPTSEFGNQATVVASTLAENELGPKSLTLSNSSIAELSANGTIVGFLSTSGYELRPSWSYVYSLVPGAGSEDNEGFSIVDNRLISNRIFDFETKNSYTVRVRVTDPNNRYFESPVSISIVDAKEDGSGPYVVRANVSASGVQSNERSQDGALSADGRYVAYATKSSNTDPEKTDNLFDIIRKDLLTGETLLVSRGNLGNAYYPSISADGRFVVYGSYFDLGLGDSNSSGSIFVVDTYARTTQLVSAYNYRGIAGVGNQNQAPYAISADGRYVAFGVYNTASTEAVRDGIYVKDLLTGQITTVTQETGVYFAAISADGSSVAVSRGDGSYILPDVIGYSVYQLNTGNRSDIPTRSTKVPQGWQASLSGDGRYLAYSQNAEIYLLDTDANTTSQISPGAYDPNNPNRTVAMAPSISTDGKYVAYYGSAVFNGIRSKSVFVYNVDLGNTSHYEEYFSASAGFSTGMTMSIASNGTKVAIFSDQTDLVPEDTNGFRDLFVVDLVRPITSMSLSGGSLSEDAPVGTVVGNLMSVDMFSNAITVSYSLVAGTGDTSNSFFEVVGNALKLKKELDYETATSHSVRVRATDAQGRFLEKTFNIDIVNQNEAPTEIAFLQNHDYDFDSGLLPSDFSGSGGIQDVQGYQGLGPSEEPFNAKFLRSDSGVTLTLTGLPEHDSIDLGFLLAIIDSWDGPVGSEFWTGDYFNLSIDGKNLFREAFYGYVAPPGGLITLGVKNLGFSPVWFDGAFDMNYEPRFQSIAHTGSNLIVSWAANGPGWQGGDDESWAIDNLSVVIWKNQFAQNLIPENAGVDAVVGVLGTRDADSGSTFTYQLVSGAGDSDNSAFHFDGNVLKANDSFDFESKSSYSVRVRSTDQGGLFTEKVFVITVSDVNESPTDITLSASQIPENAGMNAVVGVLSTSDPDSNDVFSYTLVSGSGDIDNSLFNVSGSQLRASNNFDFESKTSYSLRIRSTDQKGLYYEKVFLVSVTDVNEFSVTVPVDTDPTVNRVRATDPVGTTVGITAYSVDLDGSNNTVTYSLDNSAGGLFAIHPQTGVVTIASSLVNVASDSLSITVRATGSDGSSKTAVFSIEVLSSVSIGGTAGNDQFIVTHLGGNQWSISRNGTMMFNGYVSTGGSISISGADGTDSLAVYGTSSQDSFTVNASSILLNGFTIAGASIESRSLYGMGLGDTFAINSSIQAIYGGDGQDRFNLADAAITVDLLDGGNQYDTVDYSQRIAAMSLNIGSTSAPSITSVSGIDAWVGTQGGDTLVGQNILTDWAITGPDSTQINSVDYSSFENLTGGSATDRFQFWYAASKITGLINGGLGTDQVSAFNNANTWQLTGAKTGSIVSTGSFTDIENIVGGTGVDRFIVQPAASFTSVDGGNGNDEIDYKSYGATISVTVATRILTALGLYTSIESFIGSSLNDSFNAGNATNTWVIDGDSSGSFTATGSPTIRFSSFELLRGGSGADTFTMQSGSVPNILAGSGIDTIIGPNQNNSWRISASAAGTLNATTIFREFENVTGGSFDDNIEFAGSGAITKQLSGGAGVNTLSYQTLTASQPVVVNQTQGVASRVGSLTATFQIIIGGSGNDTLYAFSGVPTVIFGNAGNDTIYGSTGRDILIGGTGADTIRGGGGEDILIGGTTSYDTTIIALQSIRSEWLSSRTYNERIGNLRGSSTTGAPLNGAYYLRNNVSDTLFDDGAIDTLFGEGDTDWFIASSQDLKSDLVSGEQVLDPNGS